MKRPRFLDLTMPFVPGKNIRAQLHKKLPVYLGHECYAYDLAIRSHTGTYFETSSHVFRNADHTDAVPPSDIVLPACVIRLSAANKGAIDAPELRARTKNLRKGDALLVATRGRRKRYFTEEAAAWMVRRGVKLLGAELDRYDTGFVNPTGFFLTLFRARIPIVANLAHWDRLPAGRCRLLVLSLLVRGICTVPTRVIAVLGGRHR